MKGKLLLICAILIIFIGISAQGENPSGIQPLNQTSQNSSNPAQPANSYGAISGKITAPGGMYHVVDCTITLYKSSRSAVETKQSLSDDGGKFHQREKNVPDQIRSG